MSAPREGKTQMSEVAHYRIGSDVVCPDGACGYLKRVVIDPVAKALRHLVVEPHHRQGLGRLVPVEQVASVDDAIHLRCTRSEFEAFPFAEEMHFVSGTGQELGYQDEDAYTLPYFSLRYGGAFGGIAAADAGLNVVSYDRVPQGEVEVERGDHVLATDGPIGRVRGLVIDPADQHVTHVLLDEGHLWGHKQVAIPITAVTKVDDRGAHLELTKDQVRDLPAVRIEQR
jgi:sporulation protein YlmC with PRC-barrel domain